MAFVTEGLSLCSCIVVGVVVAACSLLTTLPDNDDWPGSEMTGRGTMATFYSGIPIAFFSGLGVAVGLLDSQTNSLVGVAISASLLPPAVNAGMLWTIGYKVEELFYRKEGTLSLSLTVMNIGVIIVASMLMFRLKETLPIEKSIFWSDLGVARKIYHNVAFLPVVHQEPDDEEIMQRVQRFFPRCSKMIRDSKGANGTDLFLNRQRNLHVSASDDDSSIDRDEHPIPTGLDVITEEMSERSESGKGPAF